MKQFLLFSILYFLCYTLAEAQTYANIPGPENVLLVYNLNSGISDSVKIYYRDARGIPASNIFGIPLPNSAQYQSGLATLIDSGEVIYSNNNRAAWDYYKDKIADTIEYYLTNTYVGGQQLKNTIRYIVLCKGIPLKLWTYENYSDDEDPDSNIISNHSWSHYRNVCVDALVCLLYQNVINLYNTYSGQTNPYYTSADMSFTFNNRFITNHFTNGNGWKLNYLVSRLDGNSYNDVVGMINRSKSPDKSGLSYWVFDADTCHTEVVTKEVNRQGLMSTAQNNLISHSFNTNPSSYDPNCDFIVDNPGGDVIGYTSCGRHSWLGSACVPFDTNYMACLSFNYAHGAVFNTFESYNGAGMYQIYREGDFGLVSDFIKAGGTGGLGHTWEPALSGAAKNNNLFNLYAMGYGLVDAAYQSIPYLAWNNVVVGDPLTTIAWGKQTLQDSIVFEDVNLITGELDIAGNAAFITDGTTLRFKHNGFITGEGYLIELGRDYVIETIDWNKSVFKSKYNNHPMLIWAPYPGEEYVYEYKIYRKWESAGFELIGSASNEEFVFVDNELEIIKPDGEIPKNAQY